MSWLDRSCLLRKECASSAPVTLVARTLRRRRRRRDRRTNCSRAQDTSCCYIFSKRVNHPVPNQRTCCHHHNTKSRDQSSGSPSFLEQHQPTHQNSKIRDQPVSSSKTTITSPQTINNRYSSLSITRCVVFTSIQPASHEHTHIHIKPSKTSTAHTKLAHTRRLYEDFIN